MDNFQKTNDLYIKMNARGKLLSDFEIFKAKLQNSSIIKDILKPNATNQEIILYISKYNNQYAEFFYRLFQEGYNDAMLVFLKEMVRDSYLSYVSRCGVAQKEYRDEYQKIRGMNGRIFYRYLECGGKDFCTDSRKADLFDAKMGYYSFKNCINLSDNRKEVLMIAGTTVRAYSMELYTYLLYRELIIRKVKNVKLVLYTSATLNNNNVGFPYRYIEVGNIEVGYSYAVEDINHPYLYKTDIGIQKMSFGDVISTLVP